MRIARSELVASAALLIAIIIGSEAVAAPAPDVAKRCLRAAYMLFPYKRPGAGPMNGDRLFYYERCLASQGNALPERPAGPRTPDQVTAQPETP